MHPVNLIRAACAGALSLYFVTPAVAGDSITARKLELVRVNHEISEILERTRPKGPNAVPIPKFAIKSADNRFIMTIGGTISPILGFDIGNNLYNQDGAGISFVTQSIPVPAQPGKKGDFFINPLGNTAVDMQIVGFGGTANEISGYIKIGSNGITNAIKLKKAYVSWRGLTAGMKSTLMKDGDACQPPTIDPQGPCGLVGNTAYEVSYTSRQYDGFRFAAALDMPTFYSSNGYYWGKDYPVFDGTQVADYGDAEQIIPDIPLWAEYTFTSGTRVRLSGLMRSFSYRDKVTDKTRHKLGWGLMLSGNITPSKPIVLYYQAAYGKGIGNYIQDLAGLPLSFLPEDSRPGHMTATPMAGFTFGASYSPVSWIQFNAVSSHSRLWDAATYCRKLDTTQNYKCATYLAVNCFWNISPYLQWGVEYLWGNRRTWDHTGAHDSRIQTQLAFSF